MAPAVATLGSHILSDGRIELDLDVTAHADLDDLVLEIDLPTDIHLAGGELVRPVGPMAAGDSARLVAWVAPGSAGAIVAGARLHGGGVQGGITTRLTVGERDARAAATHVIATPLGPVTEVGR
jgi:hypothetical protein